MNELIKIAIIGSRETSEEYMKLMAADVFDFIEKLQKDGYAVETRSGGCWKGPDQIQFQAAERFPDVKHVCYLPDDRKLWLAKRYPNVEFRIIEQDERYSKEVDELHPYPERLSEFARKLHGRNLNIIAGDNLDLPVDAVLYWAPLNPEGIPTGGTAMGVKSAMKRVIPCFRFDPEVPFYENYKRWA